MAKRRRKKYDPIKEVGKITATTTGVVLGTQVVGSIGALSPHTPSGVYSAMGMMGTIPVVQTGGSIIKSLEMLSPPKKRKKKRR